MACSNQELTVIARLIGIYAPSRTSCRVRRGEISCQGRKVEIQSIVTASRNEARARLVVGAVESRQDDRIHGPGRSNREAVDDHL